MDLVLVLRRKTVAPATAADSASTTVPMTTRWPKFCAWAWGRSPPRPVGIRLAANAAKTTTAAHRARLNIILPLPLLRGLRRPRRRHHRRRATTPAAPRRPLRTRCRTPRTTRRRLLLFHPLQCQDYF